MGVVIEADNDWRGAGMPRCNGSALQSPHFPVFLIHSLSSKKDTCTQSTSCHAGQHKCRHAGHV